MTPHADILDSRESMAGGFWASVFLHGSLIAVGVFYAWMASNSKPFGDPDAGGTAVGVQAVKSIPLAHQGQQNPVANDTESQVPQTPAPPVVRKEVEKAPPPDAIPIKSNVAKTKPAPVASTPHRFQAYKPEPNQLTTKAAPQVSSPLYSAQPGAGQIGTGAHTTLGSRCGAYAEQIRQLVATHWNTGEVDARLQNGPVVIATFDLARNGNISNFKLLQRSNIAALDNSVQRAVLDASPFPPMPNCIDKDTARVEFNFELKR
jgi:periplasmic protein TonB